MGVLITALSVAGAFGIGRLIFQNGILAGPLGFQPQGFIDAWAPLFFGAMVFGVAMDYTLFMLSAAKERYETHADPEHAMMGSMRTSGRVVLPVVLRLGMHHSWHHEPAWVSWRLQTLERLESWNKSTPHRSGTRLS
jgi:hypothetical protein